MRVTKRACTVNQDESVHVRKFRQEAAKNRRPEAFASRFVREEGASQLDKDHVAHEVAMAWKVKGPA